MTTKTKSQFKHTKKRFRQRFGLSYHKNIKEQIIKKIQKGVAVPLGKQNNRVSRFIVNDIEGKSMVVVYDKKRKNIVTAWEKQ